MQFKISELRAMTGSNWTASLIFVRYATLCLSLSLSLYTNWNYITYFHSLRGSGARPTWHRIKEETEKYNWCFSTRAFVSFLYVFLFFFFCCFLYHREPEQKKVVRCRAGQFFQQIAQMANDIRKMVCTCPRILMNIYSGCACIFGSHFLCHYDSGLGTQSRKLFGHLELPHRQIPAIESERESI